MERKRNPSTIHSFFYKAITGYWRVHISAVIMMIRKISDSHQIFHFKRILHYSFYGFYYLILSLAMKIPFDPRISVRTSVCHWVWTNSSLWSVGWPKIMAITLFSWVCTRVQFGNCSDLLLVGAEWEVLHKTQNAVVPAIKI